MLSYTACFNCVFYHVFWRFCRRQIKQNSEKSIETDGRYCRGKNVSQGYCCRQLYCVSLRLIIWIYCREFSYRFRLRVLKFAVYFLYRFELATRELPFSRCHIASHHFRNIIFEWSSIVSSTLMRVIAEKWSPIAPVSNRWICAASLSARLPVPCGPRLRECRDRCEMVWLNGIWYEASLKDAYFVREHYWRILRISISMEDVMSSFRAHIRSRISDFLESHITLYVYFYFFFYLSFFYEINLYFCYFTLFCVGHCFRFLSLRPYHQT